MRGMERSNQVNLGREDFVSQLATEFPDAFAQIDEIDAGLLHLEVAAFRRATERAIDAGKLWEFERHFRFVERSLSSAGPDLTNALEVSYLEDFALEWTPARYKAVKERMSKPLRDFLIRVNAKWQ